tara:strand:- start:134 stop:985 length:852 start_codon:yes stop_codon:yes gene_type:complete
MAYICDDNGNYKRTVRCSWCYNVGHSQRTCPERFPNGTPAQQKAKADKAAKEARKLEREQRRIDKQNGIKVAKVARKCGYCKEFGHIRRHCETLTKDKVRVGDAVVKYRTRLSDEVIENGVGPGALLVAQTSRWDHTQGTYRNYNNYAVITKTDFENMSPLANWLIGKRERSDSWQTPEPLRVLRLTGERGRVGRAYDSCYVGEDKEESFSRMAQNDFSQRINHDMRVIYPGAPSLPDNFLDRNLIDEWVEAYFKTTKTREHYNFIDQLDYLDEQAKLESAPF